MKKTIKFNKDWHLKNKMPIKASLEQRYEWHLAHQKNCNCRPIPEKLLSQIKIKKKTAGK